jgi:hypothetical protein
MLVLLILWSTTSVFQHVVLAAPAETDSCVTCHLALGVENLTKPAENFKSDIHAAKGFGCVSCHGGDPTIMGLEAMDKKKSYIGKPTGLQVIETCGKCHADANFMRWQNISLQFTASDLKSKQIQKSRPAPVVICRIRSDRPMIRAPRFIR